MENFIIIAVVVAILSAVIGYIIKAKKSGKKCIGCPESSRCPSSKGGCTGCSCGCNKSEK